ncbi:MAG: reverse transcriptase domain-containing protein [Lactococcus garvieae]
MHLVLSLDQHEQSSFLSYAETLALKQITAKRKKLNSNINPKQVPDLFSSTPEKYVTNLSSIDLDKAALEVLSLGPKFCCGKRSINQLDLEVQFENLFSQTEDLKPSSEVLAEHFKSTLVNSCYQYLNAPSNRTSFLTLEHKNAIRKLKQNKDIIISKPDKGTGLVIMNRTDYIQKMNNILNDDSKFRKMETEPDKTAAIEKKISKILRVMKQENMIDSATFESIRPVGSTIPRLYGLPKVHKPEVPLRPIVDMCNSPYHQVARWLTQILEPVRKDISKHSLRDTFELIRTIEDVNIKEKQMLSLDVQSLFTNVPLEETIDYLCGYIRNKECQIGLPEERLKQLLLICTKNIQFQFNGRIYRQKDGVAMGSPLGPVLADIFMGMLERSQLAETVKKCDLYKRYVDDIFCIIDKKQNPDDLLAQANTAHPCIKFTMETESEDSLAYMDVKITRRQNGSIERKVYRKPTWNAQLTHFRSFVPLKHKRNLIRCLTHRSVSICTSDTIDAELDFLKNVFRESEYPEEFIRENMMTTTPPRSSLTAEKKQIYITVPYKGETTAEILTRRLVHSLRMTYNAARLRIHYTSKPLLSTNPKDKLPELATSFCIYSFACSCGANYVGRTSRRLSDRVREHHPKWLTRGESKASSSAILDHLISSSHVINPENAFKPIYKVPRCKSKGVRQRILAVAEAIGIRLLKPFLCKQRQFIRVLQLPWSPVNKNQQQISTNNEYGDSVNFTDITSDPRVSGG